MSWKRFTSFAVTGALAASGIAAPAQFERPFERGEYKRVLLLSIDGMHAIDFANCANGVSDINGGEPYCPNLAALGRTGLTYTAASTSKPSDSFPGLMSIVTGGTPKSTGVYYDVAYDRALDAPKTTTGNGLAGGTCTPGATPTGTTTEYEEGIDRDQTKLNGGAPHAGLTDGGIASIDANKLVRDPAADCAPVYPWNFVRVNTIYNVIKQAGGYTAWSDKHPSYSSVAGPGGVIDDYYSPEINSNVIGLPGVHTPSGASCETVRDPNSDLTAWTNSFENIQCYDTLKVNAILHEINGRNHNGGPGRVPTIFGMNFQAVSVGQKLVQGSLRGGYLNAAAIPSAELLSEIRYVDEAVGQMVAELRSRGELERTLLVITSKHGQSPIDPNLYSPHPGKTGNGTSPATLLADQLPASESPNTPGGIGPTEDDISLLWLKKGADTETAVQTLESNAAAIGLGQIFYGPTVALNYNTPGLGRGKDSRTPDIIVTPNVGVTYTGSNKKQSEHGGFSHDDTNVMLLVSNPRLQGRSVSTPATVAQVAPTILRALGLNPELLDAVQLEGTEVLPGFTKHDSGR